MMRNISQFENVRWFIGELLQSVCRAWPMFLTRFSLFLGAPFIENNPFNMDILDVAEAILGEYLIGIQAGNEPDLYQNHGHRPEVSRSMI
jgi:hypothetical protein